MNSKPESFFLSDVLISQTFLFVFCCFDCKKIISISLFLQAYIYIIYYMIRFNKNYFAKLLKAFVFLSLIRASQTQGKYFRIKFKPLTRCLFVSV